MKSNNNQQQKALPTKDFQQNGEDDRKRKLASLNKLLEGINERMWANK